MKLIGKFILIFGAGPVPVFRGEILDECEQGLLVGLYGEPNGDIRSEVIFAIENLVASQDPVTGGWHKQAFLFSDKAKWQQAWQMYVLAEKEGDKRNAN